jgi:hypothetical protein
MEGGILKVKRKAEAKKRAVNEKTVLPEQIAF